LDELVAEFGVARVTVRHALDVLANEGLITRNRDRRGSIVNREPLDRRWFTLALDLEEPDSHSAGVVPVLLETQPWTGPLPARHGEGRAASAYQRLLFKSFYKSFPHPTALIEVLIDRAIYDEIGKQAFVGHTALEVLAANEVDLSAVTQTMTIGEADVETARILHLHENAPVAELRRVITDSQRNIVYLGFLTFRGDLVRLDFAARKRRRNGKRSQTII
jgi:GntR family transcriptional regulator